MYENVDVEGLIDIMAFSHYVIPELSNTVVLKQILPEQLIFNN